jgi:hypothetical protein
MSYPRFAAMILVSTVTMFVLMYLNTYAVEHVFWSQTRAWMAVVMGAAMSIIMLAFMLRMYSRGTLNLAIFVGGVVVFAAALWLVRSQATVDDVDYMKAMIPHHSIAIMTSRRAQIADPRVRRLADEIIESQEREIAEMKYLIEQPRGKLASAPMEVSRVGSVREALNGVSIPELDPVTMNNAEIARAIDSASFCTFRYSSSGRPVLAVTPDPTESPADGVVKLNGLLVLLDREASNGSLVLRADSIRARVTFRDPKTALANRDDRLREAQLMFEVGTQLRVGYLGYYSCNN